MSVDPFALPTVLHIGVSKTGTTTLQHALFRSHPRIAYYGQPFANLLRAEAAPAAALRGYVLAVDDGEDRPAPLFAPANIRSDIAGLARVPDDPAVFVLSDEMLTLPLRDDHAAIADRLYALSPDARILLTLRRQPDALASLFAMIGYAGGDAVSGFDAWLDASLGGADSRWGESYRYDRIAAIYAARFGAVQAMFFEDMQADADAYLAGIAEWIGVPPQLAAVAARDENRRRTAADRWFADLRRRLPGLHGALRALPFGAADRLRAVRAAIGRQSRAIRFTPSAAALARIAAFYAPGNRAAADAYGWDLAGRGYPM